MNQNKQPHKQRHGEVGPSLFCHVIFVSHSLYTIFDVLRLS